MTILDSSKLKEFADNNFEFNGNDTDFSIQVKNTVGKEKLLVMSNFSSSHSVFKRFVQHTHKTRACLGKDYLGHNKLAFYSFQ